MLLLLLVLLLLQVLLPVGVDLLLHVDIVLGACPFLLGLAEDQMVGWLGLWVDLATIQAANDSASTARILASDMTLVA